MSSEPPKPGAIPGWGQPADASPTEPVPRPRRTGPGRPLAGLGPAARPGGSGARGAPGRRPRRTVDRLGPAARRASPEHAAGRTAAAGPRAPGPAGRRRVGRRPGARRRAARARCRLATRAARWNPQPVAPSNSNGCLKACLIVGVAARDPVLHRGRRDGLPRQPDHQVGRASTRQGNLQACPFVSDEELSGCSVRAPRRVPLQGFFDATIGIILDKRVMPDDEDCWITSDGTNGTGRIARYQGSDAAAKFQAEKQRGAADLARTRAAASRSRTPATSAATSRASATRRSAPASRTRSWPACSSARATPWST